MTPIKWLRNLRGKLDRKKIESHPQLKALVATKSPSTGAGYSDYWLLCSEIRKRRPKEVLELDPGLTTLVIAQALSGNGDGGRVTAMEDIELYYDALLKTIPERLKPFIDAHLSSSREMHYGPFHGRVRRRHPADHRQARQALTAYVDSRIGSCFIDISFSAIALGSTSSRTSA